MESLPEVVTWGVPGYVDVLFLGDNDSLWHTNGSY